VESQGVPAGPASAARAVLETLDSAAPDTGDDATQLVLDDALDAISCRLRHLLARPEVSGAEAPADEGRSA